MENNEFCVEFVTNKTYFIEDNIHISFKFNTKSLKPTYSDWIALYKCSSNRNLEEFVTVETDITIRSPTKHGFNTVIFYANQLKNIECNLEYEFLYGNKFNEICGVSCPIRFVHKNECIFCYPKEVLKTDNCNDCISQELFNSLFARISIMDSQLSDYKLQSDEIMAMNKCLLARLNECEIALQKNNNFIDDLFYTNEPVTKDGYRWIQSCTDIDLKMSLIESQECELKDLSNQNAGLIKLFEKLDENNKIKSSIRTKYEPKNQNGYVENIFEKKNEVQDKNNVQFPSNLEANRILDPVINVETGFVPEPSSATFVFIDSDEDEV